jgi:predicted NAD-dependent protein-ADP-ribosyltransferase YbiA (DUF1768 family)
MAGTSPMPYHVPGRYAPRRTPLLATGAFPMPIYFYSTRDAYGCFSNFSPHGIKLNGVRWPTNERPT